MREEKSARTERERERVEGEEERSPGVRMRIHPSPVRHINQPLVPTRSLIYPNPLSLSSFPSLTHTSFYCLFQPSLTPKGMRNHRKEEESWRVKSKWSRNGRKQDRFSFVLFLTSFQVCPFFCTPMNTPFFVLSFFLFLSLSLSFSLPYSPFSSFCFLIFRSSVSKIFLRKEEMLYLDKLFLVRLREREIPFAFSLLFSHQTAAIPFFLLSFQVRILTPSRCRYLMNVSLKTSLWLRFQIVARNTGLNKCCWPVQGGRKKCR